jgi:hypothetical protein
MKLTIYVDPVLTATDYLLIIVTEMQYSNGRNSDRGS